MSTHYHAQSSMFGRIYGVDDVGSSPSWWRVLHSASGPSRRPETTDRGKQNPLFVLQRLEF